MCVYQIGRHLAMENHIITWNIGPFSRRKSRGSLGGVEITRLLGIDAGDELTLPPPPLKIAVVDIDEFAGDEMLILSSLLR